MKYTLTIAVILVALLFQSCKQPASSTTSTPTTTSPASTTVPTSNTAKGRNPMNLVIFLDLTTSVDAKQRGIWLEQAKKIVASLRFGDAVTVIPITDNTAQAKAICDFDTTIGAKDISEVKGTGLQADLIKKQINADYKKRGDEAIKRADDAFEQALSSNSPLAKATDLLSSIDRIRPDGKSRRTVLVFLSDMLNTAPGPNLERLRLDDKNIPTSVKSVFENHKWNSQTLKDGRVIVILPSLDVGQSHALNPLTMLKSFYSTLFESVSARLESFDADFRGEL